MPDIGMPAPGGLHVTGLGDLVVEGKLRLYRKQGLRLAAIAGVSLPSSFGSDGSQFIGDNPPTVRGRFAAQWDGGGFSIGALVRARAEADAPFVCPANLVAKPHPK